MRRRIRLIAAAMFAAPFFALLFAPAASAATNDEGARIAQSGINVSASVNTGLGIHADANVGGLYVHASLG
ncbi:MAG: hypothetical protein GEV07_25490 [Streptosporangiales bacterium]|nr:hypothetical protein [Streptosporangiales bacterium]